MKLFKIVAVGLLVAIAVCVGLVWTVGVPGGIATSALQARFARDTGYRLTIDGRARIGLWPAFRLTMNDVSVEAPGEHAMTERADIDRVRIEMPLRALLSREPKITSVTLDRPVLRLPLLRERAPEQTGTAEDTAGPSNGTMPAIDRVVVTDGTIVFANPRDKVEDRITAINLEAKVDGKAEGNADGGDGYTATGSARAGDHALKLDVRATVPPQATGHSTIPVQLTLEAPTLLLHTITSSAEVRLKKSTVMINGLSGKLGSRPFNGWASVDLAGKPLVKLDLDFQELAVGEPANREAPRPNPRAVVQWSDAPLGFDRLNYVDADIRLSAARMLIGDLRLAPVAIEATLERGVLKTSVQNLGVYDGHASGNLTIDVSRGEPAYTMNTDLDGVRALPMLSGLADFDHLDGKLRAKLAMRSHGASPRAIMAGLAGTAFVNFQDGSVRGLNLAKMIRALTSGSLSGWQAGPDQATDLTQLSASFSVKDGKATTSDIALAGPLVRVTGGGTVDLAARSLDLRVAPKLVMTTEGQGSAATPVGLGVPVAIEGNWSEPRIYLDAAGILNDPDAAYARLRELGQGLFGNGTSGGALGGGLGGSLGETIGGTLGTMIQQGLGNGKPAQPANPEAGEDTPAKDAPSPIDGILKQLFGRH